MKDLFTNLIAYGTASVICVAFIILFICMYRNHGVRIGNHKKNQRYEARLVAERAAYRSKLPKPLDVERGSSGTKDGGMVILAGAGAAVATAAVAGSGASTSDFNGGSGGSGGDGGGCGGCGGD
ncbi:hypothetical protein ABKV19_005433 [Rosa sericea]